MASTRSSSGGEISSRADAMPYTDGERRRLRFGRFRGGHGRRDEARRLVRFCGKARAERSRPASCAASASRLISKRAAAAARPRIRSRWSSITRRHDAVRGHAFVGPGPRNRVSRRSSPKRWVSMRRTSASIRGRRRPIWTGNGTGGSRGALGTGSAFHVLGEKLIEIARPHAAAQARSCRTSCATATERFTPATGRSDSSSSRARWRHRRRIRSIRPPKAASA